MPISLRIGPLALVRRCSFEPSQTFCGLQLKTVDLFLFLPKQTDWDNVS